MLKRYTSEEIRRAFGVAATDKRSDNELLDLIYDAAVGSSKFNLFITLFFNTLQSGAYGSIIGGVIGGIMGQFIYKNTRGWLNKKNK